jgi:Na+-driven multidrug efflux pump
MEARIAAMSNPHNRALRVVLVFFALFIAIGGMVLLFSSKPLILRLLLDPPEAEVSTLLLFTLKEMGGFALMLALMLFHASRDPVRNVAIIDAFTVGLCILAVTPLVSRRMLDIQSIYPGYLVWARSVIRLALAALIYLLRPHDTHWKTCRPFLKR